MKQADKSSGAFVVLIITLYLEMYKLGKMAN